MSCNIEELCSAMHRSVDEITVDWVKRVKSDSYLKLNEHLTLAQIVDHVPQMLEELCDLMNIEGLPDFQTIRAASQHGYIRSAEGYTLTQLLRELELLRDCVFTFVAETETKLNVKRLDTIRALRLVNHYFGEDILFVVEHFTGRQ